VTSFKDIYRNTNRPKGCHKMLGSS